MWLNLVAGWLALNAAVVTIATLSRIFGPQRRAGRPITRRMRARVTEALPHPTVSPTPSRPIGRHPARHPRHLPSREAPSREPPSNGAVRSRTDP